MEKITYSKPWLTNVRDHSAKYGHTYLTCLYIHPKAVADVSCCLNPDSAIHQYCTARVFYKSAAYFFDVPKFLYLKGFCRHVKHFIETELPD